MLKRLMMVIACGTLFASGCATHREPVVVIEPIYSVVRDGAAPQPLSAREATEAPLLRLRIADVEPGL